MKFVKVITIVLCLGLGGVASSQEKNTLADPSTITGDALKESLLAPCKKNGDIDLNESQRAGCQIWFFATAGNARFYAYAFPQRLGTYPDWYRVLNSRERDKRFEKWGLINDPACRPPNDAVESRAHFGFDVCPGDDELLTSVGRPDVRYRDPGKPPLWIPTEWDINDEQQTFLYEAACKAVKRGWDAGARNWFGAPDRTVVC
jgi:hypothetical protein